MKSYKTGLILIVLLFSLLTQAAYGQCSPSSKKSDLTLFEYLKEVSSTKQLTLEKTVTLDFPTFHPQGMVKIADFFYLTAVEVIRWPKPYKQPLKGYDRDEGLGVGHLFKFDADGHLIDSIRLGESSIYHPGGIDFDGHSIWVPVCEYRPGGASILYRVDPQTMKAEEVLRCKDAIGAVAYNRESQEIIGMNWGAESFYKWRSDGKRWILQSVERNLHQVVHYQDAHYIGNHQMACSGLRTYKSADGKQSLTIGGIQVIDMQDYRSLYILPVELWTPSGSIMTGNPFYLEKNGRTLYFYFAPEDNHSTLYIYKYTL